MFKQEPFLSTKGWNISKPYTKQFTLLLSHHYNNVGSEACKKCQRLLVKVAWNSKYMDYRRTHFKSMHRPHLALLVQNAFYQYVVYVLLLTLDAPSPITSTCVAVCRFVAPPILTALLMLPPRAAAICWPRSPWTLLLPIEELMPFVLPVCASVVSHIFTVYSLVCCLWTCGSSTSPAASWLLSPVMLKQFPSLS